jgi:HEAT repeat protein
MEANIEQLMLQFIESAQPPEWDELESTFLEELVAGFQINPKEARRAVRRLLARNHRKFLSSACRILKKGAEAPGHEYLMKLMVEADLMVVSLADPMLFPLETAVSLANNLALLDPLVDLKLVRSLFDNDRLGIEDLDVPRADRVLDILASLPKNARIIPLLIKLLRASSPRLRSKAVLLLCQTTQNPQWVARMLTDEDPEVRASAVQGLWGTKTPAVRAVLRDAMQDEDCRVVANALVGLYLLDGRSISPEFEQMARQPAPLARAAAAAAMGQTLDACFVPVLKSMLKDHDADARGAAIRALVNLRANASPPPAQEPRTPAAQASPAIGPLESSPPPTG